MDNNEKFASNATEAIARTLLYSDIFDYPLSEEEIWKYLLSDKNIDRRVFDSKIKKINSIVLKQNGFFYMDGKSFEISERMKKYKESQRKIKIAQKTIRKLFLIPTVLFIGLSGNLAMMNAQREDDIDLFVIARKNTPWLTRLSLILYLKILGKHRKRGDKNISDKFCLNMLIDEDKLAFPKNSRNLYTAHEVSQLMPIMEKGNIYKKFISANKWITEFMPNAYEEIKNKRVKVSESKLFLDLLGSFLSLPIFERITRFAQKLLIRRNLTREIIKDDFIALHPKDYKKIILSKYYERLSQYGL